MLDKYEQLKADYESLWQSVVSACGGSGCINAHELRITLDAQRRVNNVLRGEIKAWRAWKKSLDETFPGSPERHWAIIKFREAVEQTDSINALDVSETRTLVEALNVSVAVLRAEVNAWRAWFDLQPKNHKDEHRLFNKVANMRAATDAAKAMEEN